MSSRRALLLSLCIAALPGAALAQAWRDQHRVQEEWERSLQEEMRRERREAERRNEGWHRDTAAEERERAARERARREEFWREQEERRHHPR